LFEAKDFGPGWAIVVLFHDAKLDVPALTLALQSEPFYIGFMGSRTTQADRRQALLAAGFRSEDLARIHGPVGLDIGGRDPAMIGLSIIAEIVAVRHHRTGAMMSKPER
jgi:xanthine dehydrogenase accessory factor